MSNQKFENKESGNGELKNWRTGISQAFWCHMDRPDSDDAFEPACEKVTDEKNNKDFLSPICWFDKLLRGGIKVPDTSERPLSFLLTGPPGSGKSSLALELCYMLAKNEISLDKDNSEKLNPEAKNSIYLSSESTANQILQKADEFKWNNKDIIHKYSKTLGKAIEEEVVSPGNVVIFDSEQQKQGRTLLKMVKWSLKMAFPVFKAFANSAPADPGTKAAVKAGTEVASGFVNKITQEEGKSKEGKGSLDGDDYKKKVENLKAQILIIDSLNSIPKEKQKEKIFNSFLKALSGKIEIVVFILDSAPNSSEHKFWEYLCDNVIRLDSVVLDDYWMRTIEVKKARFQEHIQGKQVFKICSSLDKKTKDFSSPIAPRYSHPYRNEGGLFIYPSIHYYLSRYKRIQSEEKDSTLQYAKAFPEGLNSLVSKDKGGLIPEGRCTAFLGQRGAHKSHLGYLHLLSRMLIHKESAMVISLRDDEAMTKRTMCRILAQEPELKKYAQDLMPIKKSENEGEIIKWLEEHGRLEILYYHPGYITPEEFTHRMIMSVRHIKCDGLTMNKDKDIENPNWDKLTVLFNSLDQLSSRFPLCAKQDIFVPGLIDSLNGESVTSIFVAVETIDQPLRQYGLLPMADLVLTFDSKTFKFEYVLDRIANYEDTRENDPTLRELMKKLEGKDHNTVTVNISRFAGGEKAGAQGILELITRDNHEIYDLFGATGLHFIPLYKKISQHNELAVEN